jgi:tetratricopeptide (TPR) repeat protein
LHERLQSGSDTAGVQVLHGIAGVGKTQLAIEYAHRYAQEYDIVWWVDAEQRTLIGEQLATLAATAGWADRLTDAPVAIAEVQRRLRGQPRWLVVFDNADGPESVRPWLPQGPGHVLITSRNPGWGLLAHPAPIDVLPRDESVALLSLINGALESTDADRLAQALGDLPLALVQAAGVLHSTGISANEYLHTLAEQFTDAMADGIPASYPLSLAAAVRVSVDQLRAEDEAADQLLRVSSFLAAEPIPVILFSDAPAGSLPEPLDTTAKTPIALRRSLGRVGRYGLARIEGEGPVLHRLTQNIIHDLLTTAERQDFLATAEALVAAAAPAKGNDPRQWARWKALMPHLLALRPDLSTSRDIRYAGGTATIYFHIRGDNDTALDLAQRLFTSWRANLGPDDPETLRVAIYVAMIYQSVGRYTDALRVGEDTLTRCKHWLGDDHETTRDATEGLALVLSDLGRYEPARVLLADNLARNRRLDGDDHPRTLAAAGNLGDVLRRLGELDLARELHADTLTRKRRVLGEDHPHTLSSVDDLATDLCTLGHYNDARRLFQDALAHSRRTLGADQLMSRILARGLGSTLRELGMSEHALELHQDIFDRCRRLLGDEHLETLQAATELATDFYSLGRYEAARILQQETLARSRRLLGDEHPQTLTSVQNLASTIRKLEQAHSDHPGEAATD